LFLLFRTPTGLLLKVDKVAAINGTGSAIRLFCHGEYWEMSRDGATACFP
jgi:hypothetical protein